MSIESYNENQEQTPKLTEAEKEEMYTRCKEKIDDAMLHLGTLCSRYVSKASKLEAANKFKELFNEGAFISVGHDRMMNVDNFCDKLIMGKYDLSYLKQLNASTRFRQGQFLEEKVPKPDGNFQIIRDRKIDSMSFKPRIEGTKRIDRIHGLDDIKPESVKIEEYQLFQNGMTKSTAMYNEHQGIDDKDKEDANNILKSIA